jgi:hypothetical protein
VEPQPVPEVPDPTIEVEDEPPPFMPARPAVEPDSDPDGGFDDGPGGQHTQYGDGVAHADEHTVTVAMDPATAEDGTAIVVGDVSAEPLGNSPWRQPGGTADDGITGEDIHEGGLPMPGDAEAAAAVDDAIAREGAA